ncbi:MAG: T9SS type A sorting domain-containing protein [Ignavibacteria bacterium]|nr:T9SS type A sorting domain-containing protein [Ignavibacteria bacterium]MCU7520866.1 T9SS type A sorting domain-containing protein [Ignavibacteria bacterium]
MKNLFTILLCWVMFYLVLSDNYLHAQWTQTKGPSGGSVASLAVSGPNILAAVGQGQGIFLSTDNGKSWSKIKNIFPEYNYVTSVAAPGSNTIAGTGEGLYLSTDNGINWTMLNSGPIYARAFASTGTRIFCAGDNGLYYSTDNGNTWTKLTDAPAVYTPVNALAALGSIIFTGTDAAPENSGVYLSTDNGQSWAKADSGLSNKMVTSFAVIDSNIFAGTHGGVFLSTNHGASWSSVSTGLVNTYVTTLAVSGKHLFAGTKDGVFLTTDNGTNWNKASSGIPDKAEVNTFAVNGTDIFAGTNYLQGIDGMGLYVSTNSGASWTAANKGIVNTTVTCLVLKGSDIFAGTHAGLFHSGDDGNTWEVLTNGLGNNSISVLAVSGDYIFAGTDSNGVFRSNDKGTTWTQVNSGLKNLSIKALFVHGTDLFAGLWNSGAFRSTDNGQSWREINNGLTNPGVTSFTANNKYIFAGTGFGGVFRSSDNGDNWTATKKPDTKYLYSMASIGDVIFAGHDMGYGVIRSTDNGDSWQLVQGGFIFSLAVSGTNLFIGSDNGVSLYDGSAGTTKKVGTGFPDLPVFEIISMAASVNELYAGSWNYGVWKRPLSEMIMPAPQPGIPNLISVKNNSNDQPLDLTLSWNKASAADSYYLIVSNDSLFKDVVLSDSALADTSKEIKGLKEGMKYYWKVSSKNQAGKSPFSEVWNFTTILYAPEGLGASVQNNKKINLTWKDNSENEAGYIIERKMDADFIPIDTVNANTLSYTDSTAKPATYHYRIYAYTPFAVSAYSNIASITLTGVDAFAFIPNEFRLFQNYPNPFNPVSTIRYWLPERSFVELKIFDMLGREVSTLLNEEKDPGEYKIQFNASGIPSGVYIYTISAGRFTDTKKFILLK